MHCALQAITYFSAGSISKRFPQTVIRLPGQWNHQTGEKLIARRHPLRPHSRSGCSRDAADAAPCRESRRPQRTNRHQSLWRGRRPPKPNGYSSGSRCDESAPLSQFQENNRVGVGRRAIVCEIDIQFHNEIIFLLVSRGKKNLLRIATCSGVTYSRATVSASRAILYSGKTGAAGSSTIAPIGVRAGEFNVTRSLFPTSAG